MSMIQIKNRPLTTKEIRENKLSREEFSHQPRNPIYLVLDNLRNSHNIGTILRLADAVLVEKVFICGDGPLPPSKRIKKSSIGAERWVSWEHRTDAYQTILELKQKGFLIVTAEIATNSIDYRDADYRFPLALVLGREDRGVRPEIVDSSDMVVHLPMQGMANSINVSTVAAVLLYHFLAKGLANLNLILGPCKTNEER